MSSPRARRDELVAAILRATADVAARRTAHGQAVAERQGLAAADVEVLTALSIEGAMTVGAIGELTGLTTGATTRMVDRLEQAGFVRRVADPADRRRVIVEPAGDRASAVVRAFEPVELAARQALAGLDEPVLEGIHGYLAAFAAAIPDAATPPAADGPAETADVGAPDRVGDQRPARVRHRRAGRPDPRRGRPRRRALPGPVQGRDPVGAGARRDDHDPVPAARLVRLAEADRRRVGQRLGPLEAQHHGDRAQRRRCRGPWSCAAARPASRPTCATSGWRRSTSRAARAASRWRWGAPLASSGCGSGAGPATSGSTRPAGVAVLLTLAGGYRSAELDGVEAWSPGRIASPGAEAAPDRFEIEVAGGANKVAVTVA